MSDTLALDVPKTPPTTISAPPSSPDIAVCVKKGDPSPEQTAKLTPIAQLNVGDKSASVSQNSKETAERARGNLPEAASHTVTHAPDPKTQVTDAAPVVYRTTYSSRPSERALYANNFASLIDGNPSYVRSSTTTSSRSYDESASRLVESTRQAPMAFTRYLLHAFDVHDMGRGSSPSMIHIRGKNQEILKSIKLEPGSSQLQVDLPEGEYTFEAVSGKRPDTAKTEDKKDNFGVKIYRENTIKPSEAPGAPRAVQ